ncbi:uncharacterized protein LOC134681515 [Mytilus trossulus]|uniref:uncharacterized protein LOC134681515 n=1 Tax=Mytilus trossulus TaxID=6551 RepID=UPI0030040643
MWYVFYELFKSTDIFLIEEHWLFNFQLNLLNELNQNICGIEKEVDDKDTINPTNLPRGYGGTGYLWKKDLDNFINPLDIGNDRICCVELLGSSKLLLVSVYLPCKGTPFDSLEFYNYVPTSSNFDITLIITLLRNLTDMTSPCGFDRLPTAIQITPGSDLARIKYYRNYLAHLDDAKIDNKFCQTAWDDITEAIGRLGGMPLKKECDKLKTKILNQANEEIIQDIKASKDETIELKQLLENLTNTHEFEHINKEIEDWEKGDQMFVSTTASEYVMECLQENSCVTLTGSSGVGKSFTARHAALVLQREGYKVIPIYSPTNILYYYDPGKQTVLIVDDICGNYTADQHQIETWVQLLPVINRIVEDKCCKIIVSCRLHIYKDNRFNLLSPFKSCECNLISDELCLTSLEKTNIADMYIGSNVKNINEVAKQYDFFPLLCFLYHNQKDDTINVSEFFEHPFVFYKNELDILGKYKVCSLAFVVLFNNRLEEKWFKGEVKDQQRQILEDTCDACGLNRSTTKTELEEALNTLEGTFMCKENGIYRALHDKLFDFLAHYFGLKYSKCFIDHGNDDLIEGRFVWKNSLNAKTFNNEFIIEITNDNLKSYLGRLIKDWSKGKVRYVFHKKDMKESSFQQLLLHYLLKLDKSNQTALTNTNDTYAATVMSSTQCNLQIGEYPLIFACNLGYTDMVEWILQTNIDVNQRRNDGTTGLSMACQKGHTTIVNMLLKKNPNVDLCNSFGHSSLFKACQKGHSDIVKLLLENNPNVNLCDRQGFTPLTLSCSNNNIRIVELLLQHGANIDAQTLDGGNALYFSSLAGNLEIAQLLLVNNADCNICIYSKDHLTNIFTNHANKELVSERNEIFHALMSNAPLNVQDYVRNKPGHNDNESSDGYNEMIDYAFDVVAGSSPLHIACFMGRIDIVRCLLDHNANINMTKEDGVTPLSYACEVGHEDLVRILLEEYANVDSSDNDGFTPLIKACLNNQTSIVKLLIERKPDSNAKTFDGAIFLYFSALAGNLEIVQLLLENNADCNKCIYSKDRLVDIFPNPAKQLLSFEETYKTYHAYFEKAYESHHALMSNAPQNVQEYVRNKPGHNDNESSDGYNEMIDYASGVVAGSSPLHIACFMGRIDIVRCLLDNNADINITKEDGTTPLSYACEVGHTDVVKMLLERKPNVDACDDDGFTPLIKSCLNNHTSIVKLLIEHKPDINARTVDGGSALYFSSLAGNLEILQLLLVKNANSNICIYSKYRWRDIFSYHAKKPLASKIYDSVMHH